VLCQNLLLMWCLRQLALRLRGLPGQAEAAGPGLGDSSCTGTSGFDARPRQTAHCDAEKL
jgi:hypothetical protein